MERKIIKNFTHNCGDFLKIQDNTYKQWVFKYTFLELEKDLGIFGDITTQTVFKENFNTSAKIIAKEAGIVAGIQEIKYFLNEADKGFRPRVKGDFKTEFPVKDGDAVSAGDTLLTVSGEVYDLLAVERVVLNLLMRMSGIATFTRKIVDLVADYEVLICPTRKTLWGLLDKRAVVVGGGGTHRLSLSDAILIKDTHLDLVGRDIEKVLGNIAKDDQSPRFVEIEVENGAEALKAGEKFEKLGLKSIAVIMFDNMRAEEIKSSIEQLKKKGFYEHLLLEASGGITEKNVVEYAKTGVDIISMGVLTSGVKGLDMAMKI